MHATRHWPEAAWAPPARRRPQRSLGRARAIALALSVVGASSFAIVLHTDVAGRPELSALLDVDRAVGLIGLGLDEAVISGQQFTLDTAVYDALDLPNVRSLVRFDSVAARTRIERLPWVHTATVSKVLPGRVEVRLTERVAAMVWRDGASDVLVDGTGRVLGPIAAGAAAHLPRITGAEAATAAPEILALLKSQSIIASRLVQADRIAGRRWALQLDHGVRIELPAENATSALTSFLRTLGDKSLVRAASIEIDLRVPDRPIVRPARSRP